MKPKAVLKTIFILLLSTQSFCVSQMQAQNCGDEGYSQFDFWIGDWEVYKPGTDTMLGRNNIKKIAGGCALLENWTGNSGFKGQSINTHHPESDMWRQRWVDQTGQVIDFEGKEGENSMHFHALTVSYSDSLFHRMTYHYLPDRDEVIQVWEQKKSKSKQKWLTVFEGLYKRAE